MVIWFEQLDEYLLLYIVPEIGLLIFEFESFGKISLPYRLVTSLPNFFNNSGGTIFESANHTIGWDGRLDFVLCPVGTYTYQISYTRKDGESPIVIDGHVNLLR